MKKIFILSMLSLIGANAGAATPWWQQPTICRLDPTKCYSSMGTGYDSEMWDADSSCRGMKWICADALTDTGATDAKLIGRADIARGVGIDSDFDTNVLNGDCFGMRKSSAGGTKVLVDGKYVNVWCAGVLGDVDETLEFGEITHGTQPTCQTLADDGFVAIAQNRCIGKSFDSVKYFIECDGGDGTLPNRLIVLNGAEPNASGGMASRDAADQLMDKMYDVSQKQHKKYFK